MGKVIPITSLLLTSFIFLSCATQVGDKSSRGISSKGTDGVSSQDTLKVKNKNISVKGGEIRVEDAIITAKNSKYTKPFLSSFTANIVNRTDRVIDGITLTLVGYEHENGDALNTAMGEKEILPAIVVEGQINTGDKYPIKTTMATRMEALPEGSYFEVKSGHIDYPVRYDIVMTSPDSSRALTYTSDQNIKYYFDFGEEGINIEISNSSNHALEILWNKSSYVDASRKSHDVINSGTKLSEKNSKIEPTTVPPRAQVKDRIVPIENINYDQQLNEWFIDRLLPKGESSEQMIGSNISIYLPIRIEGEILQNNFSFRVKDVAPIQR